MRQPCALQGLSPLCFMQAALGGPHQQACIFQGCRRGWQHPGSSATKGSRPLRQVSSCCRLLAGWPCHCFAGCSHQLKPHTSLSTKNPSLPLQLHTPKCAACFPLVLGSGLGATHFRLGPLLTRSASKKLPKALRTSCASSAVRGVTLPRTVPREVRRPPTSGD